MEGGREGWREMDVLEAIVGGENLHEFFPLVHRDDLTHHARASVQRGEHTLGGREEKKWEGVRGERVQGRQ